MAQSSSEIIDLSGIQLSKDACVVIVKTDWNKTIVDLLESGATELLQKHQVNYKVITVPGAFELVFGIKNYWDNHKYKDDKPHAFIALGCVLKGDTPHFEYVCNAVTSGIVQLNLSLPVPVIFGVLTVNNQEQADERTSKNNNKGAEAAATALKMIALSRSFKN